MPKVTRKTKGTGEVRLDPRGDPAGEGRQPGTTSTHRGRAGLGSDAEGRVAVGRGGRGGGGGGEGGRRRRGRERGRGERGEGLIDLLSASTSRISGESLGCVSKTVLLQDQSVLRLRWGGGTQGEPSAHPWRATREQLGECEYLQNIIVLNEESDVKICPVQQDQDVRATRAVPVTATQSGSGLKQNSVPLYNDQFHPFRSLPAPKNSSAQRCSQLRLSRNFVKHFEDTEGSNSSSSSSRQGQSYEATPRWSISTITTEESNNVMFHIKNVQQQEMKVSRCGGQQARQHHSTMCYNPNEAMMEDLETTVQCQTDNDSDYLDIANEVMCSYESEGTIDLDSTSPPLPPFNTVLKKYNIVENCLEPLQEHSLGSSYYGMNQEVLPMSTADTTGCVDVQNTALLHIFSEIKEPEPNLYINYPKVRCERIPQINLTDDANFSNEDITVPGSLDTSESENSVGEAGVGDTNSTLTLLTTGLGCTGGPQIHLQDSLVSFQRNRVTWTAQESRVYVPSFTSRRDDTQDISNSSAGNSLNISHSSMPIQSPLLGQNYAHVQGGSMLPSDENLHRSETNTVLQAYNYAGNTVSPHPSNINDISARSDADDTYISNNTFYIDRIQGVDQLRDYIEKDSRITLPPDLNDLILDDKDEVSIPQSDLDYWLLPPTTLNGKAENTVEIENGRPQEVIEAGIAVDNSTNANKIVSSENRHWDANEFDNLLDSILLDIEKETEMSQTVTANASNITPGNTTSNITTADSNKGMESIMKDQESDENSPSPLPSQVNDKETKKGFYLLIPVNALGQLQKPRIERRQTDTQIPNSSTAGTVSQAVSFRTRSDFRKFVVTGVTYYEPHKLHSINSFKNKAKQLETKEDRKCLKTSSENHPDTLKQKKPVKIAFKPPPPPPPPPSQNTGLVIPLESGITITIPESVPVCVASFKKHFAQYRDVLSIQPVSDPLFPGSSVSSEGRITASPPNISDVLVKEYCGNENTTTFYPKGWIKPTKSSEVIDTGSESFCPKSVEPTLDLKSIVSPDTKLNPVNTNASEKQVASSSSVVEMEAVEQGSKDRRTLEEIQRDIMKSRRDDIIVGKQAFCIQSNKQYINSYTCDKCSSFSIKKKQSAKGRKKKWLKCDSEDQDVSLLESPSPPLLKEKFRLKESQGDDNKKVKWCNVKEMSQISSHRQSQSMLWGGNKIKCASSDTDIHLHGKEETNSHTTLDSLPWASSSTSHTHNLSSTPGRWRKLHVNEDVPRKTSPRHTLTSDQWDSLSQATLTDLKLKQELERGKVTFFYPDIIVRFKPLPTINSLTLYQVPVIHHPGSSLKLDSRLEIQPRTMEFSSLISVILWLRAFSLNRLYVVLSDAG